MAQDEFISKMEQCLEGLPGVKTIVDDIVVFGQDRATHNANLDRLMTRCREKGIKRRQNGNRQDRNIFFFRALSYFKWFENGSS